jgi:phosphonate transport system substrate-binding protein
VRGFALLIALVSLLASPLPAAAPQDCPRGDLDPRYCDRDGDLVADPPDDPAAFRDPETLVFAYTPLEDPTVYKKSWEGFLKHLEKATGKPVSFFPVQSNAAEIEAMRAGRLHVAGYNTGSVPYAVNAAGFVPFAMMAMKDGEFGYHMVVIARSGGPVAKVEDLRGKTIAFTSPTSNSGYKAPVDLLKTEYKLEEGRDYKGAFTGKHDNSILSVVHGDYAAAAVADSVLDRMEHRGIVDPKAIRILYTSPVFPTTAYGVAHDLKPELAKRIRDAFFSFDWTGSGLLREFGETEGQSFTPITYKREWEIVRKIDRDLGVRYSTAAP